MEILADPEHEEHHERLEWLALDSAEANRNLADLATALEKN
ncbi:hypothetical protein ACFXKC_44945 [Streptomyces sp. NPDC059340]